MSGDTGLHDQPIIFYHKRMTAAKRVLLEHKGIKLDFLEKSKIECGKLK